MAGAVEASASVFQGADESMAGVLNELDPELEADVEATSPRGATFPGGSASAGGTDTAMFQLLNAFVEESRKMNEKFLTLTTEIADLKGKFHEKDTKNEQHEGDMTVLNGFNQRDMLKPTPFDLEPGSFLGWSEMFLPYMISIDKKWGKLLMELQKNEMKDKIMDKEGCVEFQKELRMTDEVIQSANYSLYVNLLGFTTGKAKSRVTANSVLLAFESHRYLYHRGRNATGANLVLMQSEVLRPRQARKASEVEGMLSEWKEKQRLLEDLGEEPLRWSQKSRS